MSDNFNSIVSFLLNPPRDKSYLRKVADFVRRQGVEKVLRSNDGKLTFMIPTKLMVENLDALSKKRNFTQLDSDVLSLFLKSGTVYNLKPSTKLLNGGYTQIKKKDDTHYNINDTTMTIHRNGMLEFPSNGTFLKHIKKGRGEVREEITTITGSFENNNLDKYVNTKFAGLAANKIMQPGGFKQLVVDVYCSLDTANQEIADSFINGNPYAEYFMLVDSKFINPDLKSAFENIGDISYEDIINKPTKYCVEKDKLVSLIKDTTFMENNYREFYKNVSNNNGAFVHDGNTIYICHPAIADYLYTIEMFCFCMAKLGKEFESASGSEKVNIFARMVEVNKLTDTKSTYHAIFEDTDNAIVTFEEFKLRFKQFGLCICRDKSGSGERVNKAITLRNRKKHKLGKKIRKLGIEEKKNLLV